MYHPLVRRQVPQAEVHPMLTQADREQYDVRVEKTMAVKRKQTVVLQNRKAATIAAAGMTI